jgi:LPXTG-motif cell wall-anchored protein
MQWHATHDTQREFETASKQVEVHWILWVGALMLLVASWLALRRSRKADRRPLVVTFTSAAVYALVSVWHFIEHANGADPQLAHVFLYVTALGMVAGATLALLAARSRFRARPHT